MAPHKSNGKMAALIWSFKFPLPMRCCGRCMIQMSPTLRYFSKTYQPQRHIATPFQHDITLFKYERHAFYKLLGLASFSQLAFWSYMSYVMYMYVRPASQMLQEHRLKSASSNPERVEEFKYFPKFLLSSKVQTSICIASFGMGILFFFTGCIYALRSVNQVVLLRSGAHLFVKTYTPFGGTRQLSVPLSDVSCMGSRLDDRSFLALRIKNHRFFFMMDKRGQFLHPTLFDTTVGIKRLN